MTRRGTPGAFVTVPSGIAADDDDGTLTLGEWRRLRGLDPPPEAAVEPEAEAADR